MCRETRKRDFREREPAFAQRSGSVKKTSKMGTVKNFSPRETKTSKETKRLTHATVRPCRTSGCRDNLQ